MLGQSPEAWPPVFNSPWASDSLHDFWAKRWHQILRRILFVMGGTPGRWLAGEVGQLLGTFLASGLFHELGMYMVCRGLDHRVTFFFTIQGVGVLLERVYKRVTGRRVEGWFGRVWLWIFIFGFGQVCSDAWLSRGLGAADLIPDHASPLRGVFIPMIRGLQRPV